MTPYALMRRMSHESIDVYQDPSYPLLFWRENDR